MKAKLKGINAERELVKFFWTKGWGAVRIAGSGAARLPATDIIAGNGKRILVIECKAASKFLISLEQAQRLQHLASRLGAESWFGFKIARKKWYFVKPGELKQKGNFLFCNVNYVVKAGIDLDQLISL